MKKLVWFLSPLLAACATQNLSSGGISRETAIEMAKKDCGGFVPSKDEGRWRSERDGDFWYVGFVLRGTKKSEPDYLQIRINAHDGKTDGCAVVTS